MREIKKLVKYALAITILFNLYIIALITSAFVLFGIPALVMVTSLFATIIGFLVTMLIIKQILVIW